MKTSKFKRYGSFFILLPLLLVVSVLFAWTGTVYAADGNGDKCVLCHQSQYQNFDNGKSFCLSEDPMRCVDCHGGNPTATTKEAAHYDRSAHPVVEGDISKCDTCHFGDATKRVETFDQVAGLSSVHLASPAKMTESAYADFPELDTPRPAPLSAGSVGIALGLGLTALIIQKKRKM